MGPGSPAVPRPEGVGRGQPDRLAERLLPGPRRGRPRSRDLSHDKSEAPAGARHFHRDAQPGPASSGGPGGPRPDRPHEWPKRVVRPRSMRARASVASVVGGSVTRQSLEWIYSQSHVAVVTMDQTRWTMKMSSIDLEPDDLDEGRADDGASNAPATWPRRSRIRVNDEWRRWIAENLMVGQSPESLFRVHDGRAVFPPTKRPLKSTRPCKALTSRARNCLLNRLKKRDWLLAVYRKSNRLHPQSAEIERRHKLSRDEFLREYYSTNRPVIITGMMDDWPAMRQVGPRLFRPSDSAIAWSRCRWAGPRARITRSSGKNISTRSDSAISSRRYERPARPTIFT